MVADDQTLRRELSLLTSWGKAAFAWAVAYRLFYCYKQRPEFFPGELQAARNTLLQIKQELTNGHLGMRLGYIEEGDKYLITESTPDHPLNIFADDAIASLIYACHCLAKNDTDSAVFAARRERNTAFHLARVIIGIRFSRDVHSYLTLIEESPYMQFVYSVESQDLELLKSTNSGNPNFSQIIAILGDRGDKAGTQLAKWVREYEKIPPPEP